MPWITANGRHILIGEEREYDSVKKDSKKSLDSKEREAVAGYIDISSDVINGVLRKGENFKTYRNGEYGTATQLHKSNYEVSMGEEDLRLSSLKKQTYEIDSAISKNSLSEDTVLYRGLHEDSFIKPNSVFMDKGFMSTSTSIECTKYFTSRAMLKISVSKGTNFCLGDKVEKEVILGRGHRF
jgi:hypothetical protein